MSQHSIWRVKFHVEANAGRVTAGPYTVFIGISGGTRKDGQTSATAASIQTAITNNLLLCLDSGHFHPTESIADKLSSVLMYLDDLLLHIRGLVLVREILRQRGASAAELEAHTAELERLKDRLADLAVPETVQAA